MKILNATQRMLSIRNGMNKIEVYPGQLSGLFMATPPLIMDIMKIGKPQEIGIIYGSDHEAKMLGKIKASIPYVYATDEAAISKLIDKNKDYKRKPTKSEVENLELQKANCTIEEQTKEINELKKQLKENSNSTESEQVKQLEETIKKLEAEIKELSEKSSENLGSRVKVEELEKENDQLKSENKKLKKGLDSSMKQIEDMKAEFTTACKEFNLSKKDGEWIQES